MRARVLPRVAHRHTPALRKGGRGGHDRQILEIRVFRRDGVLAACINATLPPCGGTVSLLIPQIYLAQLQSFKGHLPESQDYNLALTALCLPYSLDSAQTTLAPHRFLHHRICTRISSNSSNVDGGYRIVGQEDFSILDMNNFECSRNRTVPVVNLVHICAGK